MQLCYNIQSRKRKPTYINLHQLACLCCRDQGSPYVWAYERSTQEYLAIKQDLAEPDPLRLAWRDFIKQTIREVISHPELDPLSSIQRSVAERVPEQAQPGVQALIVEELRRLHEGVLARYGLRPSEYAAWKAVRTH